MSVSYSHYRRYLSSAELAKPEKAGMAIGPLTIVAVVGDGPDWAAYCSPESADAEWIAAHGDKLSKTAAEALFPALANSGRYYRE
jgi:hypothetical protein